MNVELALVLVFPAIGVAALLVGVAFGVHRLVSSAPQPSGEVMTYAKFFLAVVATIISGIIAALAGDGVVDAQEWVNVALLAAGACAVFAAPNVPGSRYTKTVLAVLTAVLTLAVNMIMGGFDTTELLQLAIAALGAVGVYAFPNRPSTTVTVA